MDSSWYDQKWNSSEGRMFDNFVPMFPEDVADQIMYTCTRPRHVQISDISSYATNQSYFSMKGVPPVARMGMSLGADNYNNDSWQQWQQGWGDHWGMSSMGRGMYKSPRMMMNNSMYNSGSSSPRGYGSPYTKGSSDMNPMGSFRPGSAQHQSMGGMSGDHWMYNSGSSSPRGYG